MCTTGASGHVVPWGVHARESYTGRCSGGGGVAFALNHVHDFLLSCMRHNM